MTKPMTDLERAEWMETPDGRLWEGANLIAQAIQVLRTLTYDPVVGHEIIGWANELAMIRDEIKAFRALSDDLAR